MPIERGKIREYARATAAARPAYVEATNPPVPPTFLATVVFWEDLTQVFTAPELIDELSRLGMVFDVQNLLSLEQEYVFHGPLPRAGEELRTEVALRDVTPTPTRRGSMARVRFAVEFRDPDGRLRAECLYTSGIFTTHDETGHDETGHDEGSAE
ncbi:MAG TPA: MaoC family dehydratase N-terminal domain-containing protein [Nocardioides sp.]